MILRNSLLIVLAAFLAESAGAKEEVPQSPDLELLEFLGTFEGDGKKDIDPMDLADLPGDEKTTTQSPQKKSVKEKEKKEGKGTQR